MFWRGRCNENSSLAEQRRKRADMSRPTTGVGAANGVKKRSSTTLLCQGQHSHFLCQHAFLNVTPGAGARNSALKTGKRNSKIDLSIKDDI